MAAHQSSGSRQLTGRVLSRPGARLPLSVPQGGPPAECMTTAAVIPPSAAVSHRGAIGGR